MEKLEQLQEIKNRLMEDLTTSITYVPNRRSDIYKMMDDYRSDFVTEEQKEVILTNLANCINGLPYPEPLNASHCNTAYYGATGIEQLNHILNHLMEQLPNSRDPQTDCDKAWKEIHALNESKEYSLLDTWRRETIQEFMNEACESQEETQTFGMQMM